MRTPTTTSAWRSSSQRAPDSPPRRHPPSTATTSSDLPLPPWTSSSAAQRQRHSATDARSGRQPDPVQHPCSRCRQQTRFESDAAICSSVRLSVCRMPQAQNGALHIILSTVLSSYSSRIHRGKLKTGRHGVHGICLHVILVRAVYTFTSLALWLQETSGPIYKIPYDHLTTMPKLRSTYDGRLIDKTSYSERKAFHRYYSRAES